jgi:hypothetical protein
MHTDSEGIEELKEVTSQQLLLTLPRRRSVCHAAVLYDFLSLGMLTSTREALVECVRCGGVIQKEDHAAVVGASQQRRRSSVSPAIFEDETNEEMNKQQRQRRVSLAATALLSPRLSAAEFYISFERETTLYFISLGLDELADAVHPEASHADSVDVGEIGEAWADLVVASQEHFSKRRRVTYDWVLLDAPPIRQGRDSDRSSSRSFSPPQLVGVLPLDISECIEAAYASGLSDVRGFDWTATFAADVATIEVRMASTLSDSIGTDDSSVMHLGRRCTCTRQLSLQTSSSTPTSQGAAAVVSGGAEARPVMSLQHPTSQQTVTWHIVSLFGPSGAVGATLEPLNAALESILEDAVTHWHAYGCVEHDIRFAFGEEGTWIIYPSTTELWELGFQSHNQLCRRYYVVRSLHSVNAHDSDDQSNDDNDSDVPENPLSSTSALREDNPPPVASSAEDVQEGERLPPRLQAAVALYLSMAEQAVADSSVGISLHGDNMTLSDSSICNSKYDSVFLSLDVLELVVPLLQDKDAVIALGCTSTPDPAVETVKIALGLPMVDPKRFLWSSEIYHKETPSQPSSQELPTFVDFAGMFEMYCEGHWLPMSPLNEWFLAHKRTSLFLNGSWYRLQYGVAVESSQHHHHGRAAFSGADERAAVDHVWVRRKDEAPPIRLVCQGVPMSLDRHVLMDSRCPPALLRDDIVVVDTALDPMAVQRTWRGERSNLRALDFFAFDSEGPRKRSQDKTMKAWGTLGLMEDATGAISLAAVKAHQAPHTHQPGLTHAEVAKAHDRRKSAVAAMLASSAAAKYQFKFPILPSPL